MSPILTPTLIFRSFNVRPISYHLHAQKTLSVEGRDYIYYSLEVASEHLGDLSRLPYSLKILLENMLRFQDEKIVKAKDIEALAGWSQTLTSAHEISFMPARVLMQDFTGVPSLVDLAAMRTAFNLKGRDPAVVNPLVPVDLVIDHSVTVDRYATEDAYPFNVHKEVERNYERYAFLKWGQKAFQNFRVVPPGTGICHQVNLEYLSQVVWSETKDGRRVAYPDTLVGLDSHTPMVNGLGVLAWGVGGIEAEAAMLGQPFSMAIPDVIGVRLIGELKEGVTATDLVLTITQLLRAKGVVGKFVEFYGPGVSQLTVEDRATIGNMAPEYGATCGIFPIDEATLSYLRFTGRSPHQLKLVEAYAKAQGLWRGVDPVFTETLTLNLVDVEPSVAGPKRPQDRLLLRNVKASTVALFAHEKKEEKQHPVEGQSYTLGHGDIVIAAITSCTNTSNPQVMIGAGLLARKAHQKGLKVKPWVKTSLAPGSQVVSDYYENSGLQQDLDALGFYLVGYGCTTCIGNSGPLLAPIAKTIEGYDLSVAAVLSGNRNFEGRIHPQVALSYLASPPLVVAYALAGSILVDLTKDPLGQDAQGRDVYLKDIWPSNKEIQDVINSSLTPDMFTKRYANVFEGNKEWAQILFEGDLIYKWPQASTYVKCPPFFTPVIARSQGDDILIKAARPLAILGGSITTDHISPAGNIKKESPAGLYLLSHGVEERDFNSYGSRRGNHEVMMRGTFANIRLQNEMTPDLLGGVTRHLPEGDILSIYEAAMRYQTEGVPLVVIAGKDYGAGSSRDWAAKGPRLLGVRAVIAESFERIHRSNLVGMGVLPLAFTEGMTRHSLNLEGSEVFDIEVPQEIHPKMTVTAHIHRSSGTIESIPLLCRIDTVNEVDYYKSGGILHYVSQHLED